MFKYCLSNPDGTRDAATEVTLDPSPTFPRYPDTRFPYTIHANGIIQQFASFHPGRYAWVFENTTPADPIYAELFPLQAHIRKAEGLSPYIFVYEDESGNLGQYNVETQQIEPAYVRVIVAYVGRRVTEQGGPVFYSELVMDFGIHDDSIAVV